MPEFPPEELPAHDEPDCTDEPKLTAQEWAYVEAMAATEDGDD